MEQVCKSKEGRGGEKGSAGPARLSACKHLIPRSSFSSWPWRRRGRIQEPLTAGRQKRMKTVSQCLTPVLQDGCAARLWRDPAPLVSVALACLLRAGQRVRWNSCHHLHGGLLPQHRNHTHIGLLQPGLIRGASMQVRL